MLEEYSATFRYLLLLTDTLFVIPAFYISYYLRTGPLDKLEWFSARLGGPQEYSWLVAFLVVISPMVLFIAGAYKPFRRKTLPGVVIRVFCSVLAVVILTGNILFFKHEWLYSRGLVVLWGCVYSSIIGGERILLVLILRSIRRRGFNTRRVLIVGTGRSALKVISEIYSNMFWGIEIVGFITEDDSHQEMFDLKNLGSLKEVPTILKAHAIDDLYFTLGLTHGSLGEIARCCATIGVAFYAVPEENELFCEVSGENLGSVPLVSYRMVRQSPATLFVKRIFDLLISSLVMVFFPIIYVVVGIAIKMDSPGPILYVSTRVGQNRRRFKCYKFRTMVKDADKLVHILDEVNELSGPVRKSAADPRITRVGRFLRRYSIDEIPQFINVFKGEMSLVGPRPPLPDEVEKYKLGDLRKLSMPQGLTGPWQVNGRDSVRNFEDRLRLDLEYIDNWSLWLDVKILMKTFPAVFRGAS